MPLVHAVVPVARPDLDARLTAQERAPDAVLRSAAVLGSGLEQALRTGPDWLWILDGSALPRPAALARLVERADEHEELPAPDVLASAVLGADGSVAAAHAPWFRRGETDLALRAALARVLPVRAARAGSLLVRADAARASDPPLGDLDDPGAALEWTARLLRRGTAYLVPASVADAAPAPERGAEADVKAVAALLAGGGWGPRERVWLAAEGLGTAGSALHARPAAALTLLREAAAGALSARRAGPSRP